MPSTSPDALEASCAALLIPSAASQPVPMLYARYLKKVHADFVAMRARLPARLQRAHELTCAQLTRAARENPRAAAACLASPSVATPIQCAALRDSLPEFAEQIDAATGAVVAHMLLEMCARGLLSASAAIDVPGAPDLASPSLGVVLRAPPDTQRICFERSQLLAFGEKGALGSVRFGETMSHDGFVVESAYDRVGRVTRLARVDHNPIAQFEAHPDKRGNPIDLGGREQSEWLSSLQDAFAIIEQHTPELFAEMVMLLHEVVPVGHNVERHLSASYREAIGTVYVTLHPNVMTMAEALVHEFQHNKLNLASYATGFLHNAFEPLYPSPVRPDPRPLWGILLAAHAFVPVAVLYRRMRERGHPRAASADFERRLADIDLKNHEAVEMLRANADWTPAGKALMNSLSELDAAHMAERAERGLTIAPTDAHTG